MELALALAVDSENPVVHDLRITNGTLVFTQVLEEEVAQRIKTRLLFFKGEWFLDRREGLPWFDKVLGQKPDTDVVREAVARVLRGVQGVALVRSVDATFSGVNRALSVDFSCLLEDGSVFTAANMGGPFIVEI
jgi:hypothetical protein